MEQARRYYTVFRVGFFQLLQQQQIGQMHDFVRAVQALQNVGIKCRITAMGMKKSALPVALIGHHLRHAGRVGRSLQPATINIIVAETLTNKLAIQIITQQAGRRERQHEVGDRHRVLVGYEPWQDTSGTEAD